MKYFEVESFLRLNGFSEYEIDKDCSLFGSENLICRILHRLGIIQFGFRTTFDRWANSVDFQDKIPVNEGKAKKILDLLNKMKKCYKCDTWLMPGEGMNRGGRLYCDHCKKPEGSHNGRQIRRFRN